MTTVTVCDGGFGGFPKVDLIWLWSGNDLIEMLYPDGPFFFGWFDMHLPWFIPMKDGGVPQLCQRKSHRVNPLQMSVFLIANKTNRVGTHPQSLVGIIGSSSCSACWHWWHPSYDGFAASLSLKKRQQAVTVTVTCLSSVTTSKSKKEVRA